MRERTRAPAKVNLFLRVHERQPSGYHRLETLFCALELSDEITIDVETGAPGVALEVDGPDLGPPDRNLAVRAARRFLERSGVDRSVAIRLRKRIPAGGGLGGGSSDAAAVLRAMDRMCPGTLSRDALLEIAIELGSDVPFFLSGSVVARGSGRGEVLAPVDPLPSAPVLLLLPGFAISTAEAYGWLERDRSDHAPAPAMETPTGRAPESWREAAAMAMNDFESVVFRRHPRLGELVGLLREAGALIALLSGSGSTVFGVFSDDDAADRAIALVRARAREVRIESTRTAGR